MNKSQKSAESTKKVELAKSCMALKFIGAFILSFTTSTTNLGISQADASKKLRVSKPGRYGTSVRVIAATSNDQAKQENQCQSSGSESNKQADASSQSDSSKDEEIKNLKAELEKSKAAAASAGKTQCLIYLNFPCHNNLAYGPMSGWFLDSDSVSSVDAGRCIKRAVEWYNYCGDPVKGLTVYTSFQVGGRAVASSYSNNVNSAFYGPSYAPPFNSSTFEYYK